MSMKPGSFCLEPPTNKDMGCRHSSKNTEWLTQACCISLAEKTQKALAALTDLQGEEMHEQTRSHTYTSVFFFYWHTSAVNYVEREWDGYLESVLWQEQAEMK